MKIKASIILILILSQLFISCIGRSKKPLILGKIKQVSKFSTTKIVVNKLLIGKKNLNFLLIKRLSTATFIADSEAIIKLGIDFEKLQENDISINNNSISLNLPSVEVISFSYPAEKFEFKEEWSSNSFLVKIRPEDQDEIFRLGEIELRESLLSMGVVKSCQKNTSLVLRKILSVLDFDEIYIKYRETKSLFPEFELNE